MKKVLSVVLGCLFFAVSAFAQVSVNPNDPFYEHAFNWYNRGIVDRLPPTRPYPLQNIKMILEEVLEKGNDKDREYVAEIYERIGGRKLRLYFDAVAQMDYKKKNLDGDSDASQGKNICIYPGVEGDVVFRDYEKLSVGYKMGIAAVKSTDTDHMPKYSTTMHDGVFDPSEIGPIKMYLDVNDIVAYGSENVFVQGGIYRNGYGNYLGQGLVLNDKRFHSTNISFTFMNDRISFTQQVSALGSTSSYDGNTDSLKADKILGFHSIGVDVCKWFDFAFYESTIIGKRFDIGALVPVPYMISEELSGALDGVFMGLALNFKPFPGLMFATDLCIDDFPINDFVKLKWDSKYRIAARTGVIWSLNDNRWVDKVSLSYTAITPYTYSHWDYSDYESNAVIKPGARNYQNYTNNGIKIGSMLEPNSDAIELSVDMHPISGLKLNFHGMYSRHGNVCESLTDEEAMEYLSALPGTYSTDGSIYTHAMFSNPDSDLGKHVDTAWNSLNFLSQDHLMTTIQLGVDAEYLLPQNYYGFNVTLKAGLTFEYIKNYNVDRHMYPGYGIQANSDILNRSRALWEEQLCDRTSVYGYIGVNVRY